MQVILTGIPFILLVLIWFKLRNRNRKKLKKKYNKQKEEILKAITTITDIILIWASIVITIFIISNIIFYISNTSEKQSKSIVNDLCIKDSIVNLKLGWSTGNSAFYHDSTAPVNDTLPTWSHLQKIDETLQSIGLYWNDTYYMHLENKDNFWYVLAEEVKTNGNIEAYDMNDLESQVATAFRDLRNGYIRGWNFCSDELPPIANPTQWKKLYFVLINALQKAKTAEQKQAEETEYKQSCKTISYKNLIKDATPYIGTKVYYRGKILQAQTENWGDFFRLAITDMWYGLWDDVIWVLAEKTKFVEDDVIEVWWAVREDYCYTTVEDKTLCIPSIQAEYIE